MVAKDYNKTKGSGKAEVGEIDTSSPIQSVKDAVSLFGEGAFSGGKQVIWKPRPVSAERMLAKETQLHLASKELNKLKEQLNNAETTKARALLELERAKLTVEHLAQKLKITNQSKDAAIQVTEEAKYQAKLFAEAKNANPDGTCCSPKRDFEIHGVQYVATVAELDSAKQKLWKLHQDYDASIDAKVRAEKQATEAENAAEENMDRVDEISREVTYINESIQHVQLADILAKELETRACAEKDEQKKSHKVRLQESQRKLIALKKDIYPDVAKKLEADLREASSEIEVVRNEMENSRAADLDSVKTVTMELNGAKESLSKVAEEESFLRNLVETLKLEADAIKKQHSEAKEKEGDMESVVGNLHLKLLKAKSELEEALSEEAKVRGASSEVVASLHLLASESARAKRETDEMKCKVEEMKLEAEARKTELEEAENKLRIMMIDVEEAKAAEARALDQIKILSEKNNAAGTPTSEPGSEIMMSRDEYESLSRNVDESVKLADLKVAAAMARVEAVKASESEALKRLEATQKEIGLMRTATGEALKKAEMAEAARKAVERELRRWREQEQKKAAETASRILDETAKSFEPSLYNYQFPKLISQEKAVETRKREKPKTSISKKALMPSLSAVFPKKKNKVDGGSPSYLPGEKLVW